MKFWNWGPTTIWHSTESVTIFFLQNHSTLLQVGKFPDSEEVTAAVRIGQPLSMLVYAKDDEGNIQTHTRTGVIILTPVKALVLFNYAADF